MKVLALFALALTLQTASWAQGAELKEQPKYPNGLTVIDRFHQVDEGFYRGAYPETLDQMKTLKAYKIKTVISLATNEEKAQVERANAKRLGINLIEVPLDGWKAPSDAQTAEVQKLLNDPSLRPIYIHCKHGRERTGIMIAIYRVFTNGWPAEKAYQEAKDIGFRPIAWNFRIYLKRKLGLID